MGSGKRRALPLQQTATLIIGESPTALEQLASGSVDALVCDPPCGIGFMGREWDNDKGGRDQWIDWLAAILRECYRTMKPGAHGLVWALPRTSHWTALAVEAAGFELRDCIYHLFGSGFPKSLNISKAIDKRAGVEREVIAEGRSGSNAIMGDLKKSPPTSAGYLNGVSFDFDITAPATEDAKRWDGYGTGLKPAAEIWWLIRKPFKGSIVGNVLEHGTGALNIDGCRIPGSHGGQTCVRRDAGGECEGHVDDNGWKTFHGSDAGKNTSRFPAHLILSPDAAAMLDEQAGFSTSPPPAERNESRKRASGDQDGAFAMTGGEGGYGDSGGPSRFYYQPKPSRAEKEYGLLAAGIDPSTGGQATGREDDSAGVENPRAGANRTGGARNIHPTVKSVALMSWLVRLITPAEGLVLDPFTGSGTTAVAVINEDMRFVGTEMSEQYAAIAQARIDRALEHAALRKQANAELAEMRSQASKDGEGNG